jgi:tetratricopeptide (TPR) repeat protein
VFIAVLAGLAGCAASAGHKQTFAWKVEPVLDVQHGAQSSGAYYALGRYHDGSQTWDKAIDAYCKAVAADASNVEARNALGVALARAHRFEDAEATLRKAVGIDPNSAHVRSNLGFVLLLAGRPQEAVSELKTALTLDRDNVTARANLRDALAQSELRQAGSTAEAAAPPTSRVGAPVPLVAAAVPVPADLRVIDRPAAPALPDASVAAADLIVPRSLPASQAVSVNARVRLELSNGNGIKGAAARLQRWLTAEGLPAERLSNHQPYTQQLTVIQYRDGQEQAARRVAESMPAAAKTDSGPTRGLRSDVRVVLGRDWVKAAACLGNDSCRAGGATTVATATP